jgi:cyclase
VRRQIVSLLFVVFTAVLSAAPARAQGMDTVQVRVHPVARNIYMLTGRGGNIGLCTGKNGAFLIDDQYAPLTDKIRAAVASVTDLPIRFVVNTHLHQDHTGGNENMAGEGAIIVAQENVRKRMSVFQFSKTFNDTTPPAPEAALPVITFADSLTFHWNGENIRVVHVPPAHTDGDAFVVFPAAAVIHTGDLLFNNMYPFIDVDSGGSVRGVIAACDRLLAESGPNTKFIPGHGKLGDREDIVAYRNMLNTVADRIEKAVAEGKTVDEVVAMKPTADFDARFGGGYIKPDRWVKLIYAALSPQ